MSARPWEEPAEQLYRAPGPLAAPLAPAARQPLVRSARRDGRHLVTLRRVDQGVGSVVECDVYPVNSLRIEPLRPGPYTFARREDADAFVDEVVRALEYLGCELA